MAVRSKALVLFLLLIPPVVCGCPVFGPCFVMHYLVLQSS